MSWQFAAMAVSAAMQAISAKQQANATEQAALIEQAAYEEQADMARIQAQQQEADRRREFAQLEAANNNAVNYDPYSSQSFLALTKENRKQRDEDILNIQLMGRSQVRKNELGAKSAGIEAKAARRAGNSAFVKAGASLATPYAKLGGGGSGDINVTGGTGFNSNSFMT
jgi:soluble lytic murein transglycosylase-like protein